MNFKLNKALIDRVYSRIYLEIGINLFTKKKYQTWWTQKNMKIKLTIRRTIFSLDSEKFKAIIFKLYRYIIWLWKQRILNLARGVIMHNTLSKIVVGIDPIHFEEKQKPIIEENKTI